MINDALSIQVNVELAEAKTAYEAWRKEMESNPIRVRFEGDAATGKGVTSRSFGGQEMPGGSAAEMLHTTSYVQQPSRVSMSEQMAAVHLQSLTGAGFIGGSGFNPAVGPLPTAAVNTVYGRVREDVISSNTGVRHTSNEYSRYRLRALRSGIMDPMPRTDFDREGGYQQAMYELDSWQEQRIRNRSDAAMAKAGAEGAKQRASQPSPRGGVGLGGSFATAVRGGLAAYGAIETANAVIGTASTFQEDRIRAFGLGSNQAGLYDMEASRATRLLGNVPFVGGMLSKASTLSPAYAEYAYTKQSITARDLINASFVAAGQSRISADRQASVAQAGLAGGFMQQMVSIGLEGQSATESSLFNQRQRTGSMVEQRANARTRLAQLQDDSNNSLRPISNLIGKTGAQITEVQAEIDSLTSQITASERTGARERSSLGRSFSIRSRVLAGEYAGNIAGLRGQTAVALLAGDNRPLESSLAGYDSQASQIQSQFAVSGGDANLMNLQLASIRAQRNATEQQYRRSAYSQTLGIQAGSIGMSGGYSSQSLALSLQRSSALAALPGYDASRRGESVSMADQNRIDATENDFRMRQARVDQERYAGRVGIEGAIESSRLRMSGSPLGATLNDVSTSFKIKSASMSLDSPEYAREQRLFGQNSREAIQTAGFAASQNRLGLSSAMTSLNYAYDQNIVGSQAASIAGQTAEQIRSFAMSGESVNANLARAVGNRRLDVLGKQTALGFRAEERDLQNLLVNNQRDAQSPEEVFGSINAARDQINGTSGDQGQIQADALKEALNQVMDDKLREIIKAAIKDVAAS